MQFNYNKQVYPPAPFVYLSFALPDSKDYRRVPALVDTGADQTIIPLEAIANLGVKFGDDVQIRGMMSDAEPARTFYVDLSVEGVPPVCLEVVAIDLDEYALLGRDFLNLFKVTLNGPHLNFQIE